MAAKDDQVLSQKQQSKLKSKTLTRAFDIIDIFDYDNRELTAQELAQRTGIPLSTLYRLIKDLETRGYLKYNSHLATYGLGMRFFELGCVVEQQIELPEVCGPVMRQLSERFNATVMLTAVYRNEVICLEVIQSNSILRLAMERGSRLPFYAGAGSKVLMAFLPEATLDRLLQEQPIIPFTSYTLTDPGAFKLHLAQIREQGYATSDQEMNPGAVGLASPVYNAQREVVAGLTLAGPSSVLKRESYQEYVEALLAGATECSERLGYHPRSERGRERDRRRVLALK
ncbi:MAG TPA: IclR family transcriptional regulator [Chloroflexia bacterium]|nr:IclR family transcriptional regulator [Chloroflexia bacterium]